MDGDAISFGPFRLLAAQRLLLEGDNPVRLGSRAFDVLAALVERPGEVVSKKELIARVWPKTFVEDANLKIQVSALRRAIGDGQGGHRYIVTVPGRGYNFVAPVGLGELPQAPASMPPAAHNLPVAATRMIGREKAVATLVSRLSRERLVTIIGPGGIGKTTLALAVAERMIAGYEHGVWLVDLAPLGDPSLVSSAVTTVLGLQIDTEAWLPGLVNALKDRRMLLLLDNCDHVIEATASLAAAVLSGTPGVNILATSREPLGVAGERVYRLGPLSSPPPSRRMTAAEAGVFPAVQLFVERVTEVVEDFALTDANAPFLIAICRKLDGLPLAIEFAACRVEVLGVEGLAARLDKSLALLRARRRAEIPRHQTMRAVIDWSYGLLSQDEQQFFKALGIFTGGFTVEAAAAVAMDAAKTRVDAIERLADLARKSLVVADVSGAKPRFRLLQTTRAYALEKLDDSGEHQRIARLHAGFYRNLFKHAEGEAGARSTGEWLADYAREIDNLRAALNWAFSPDWAFGPPGDEDLGVALTVVALPLWMQMSLIEECHARVEYALDALGRGAGQSAARELRLQAALGWSLMQIKGSVSETRRAWSKVVELAENLSDEEYQLRAAWGLWVFHFNGGELRTALTMARDAYELAAKRADPDDMIVGDRMAGSSHHYLGDQVAARVHMERVLNYYVAPHRRPRDIRFVFNPRTSARSYLARILWLQGFPNQAIRTSLTAIEDAEATEHALSICNALVQAACPIAFWVGDVEAGGRYVTRLLDCSQQHDLIAWHRWGCCYEGILHLQRRDTAKGLELLGAALGELPGIGYAVYRTAFLGAFAEALAKAGQPRLGLPIIEEAIERSNDADEHWCLAELLRIKGELLRLDSMPEATAAAEASFLKALQLAGTQGALSWELRAAMSLAALHRTQGRSADAIACLRPVYDRFTEGFGTADLIAAKRLLDDLSDAGRDPVTSDSGRR